ncbi:MAG TPA: hypothetical protein VHN14_25420 [Kofleriaceae bacterium]|jgi:hypothetical protein|nr:hypothetical protein [Kofleriaceae bacterium]
MKRLIVVVLAACGGPDQPPVVATGGAMSGGAPTSTACDASRGKVAQLYRALARGGAPARADEVVADNTTMVMNDCVKAPDKVTACITAATTVRELETRCLLPLDEEGTEGDQFAR